MTNPGVTVLMPVYNGEQYISKAIDSILDQTYSNFELLIIDDGSNDRTIEEIKSFSDSKIRLVCNEQNIGIASTLNQGIALSTYDLIARMDADDVCFPTRLQKQVAFMQENPHCALVSTWAIEVNEQEEFINLEKPLDKHLYYNLVFQNCIYHPTVLFRKRDVISVGGYKVKPAEDYDLWCRLSREFKVNCIEEPLLKYRIKTPSGEVRDYLKKHDDEKDEIVIKNIKYYLGYKALIKDQEIKNLSVNFSSLIEHNNIKNLYNSFALLKVINSLILEKENINKNEINIKSALLSKRQYLYQLCAHQMKFRSALTLSYLLRSFSFLQIIMMVRIKRKLKRISSLSRNT